MFSRFQKPATQMVRQLSTSKASNNKVAVMGASGGKHNFFLRLHKRHHNWPCESEHVKLNFFQTIFNSLLYGPNLPSENIDTDGK